MSLSFVISIIVVNRFEGFQLIGRKRLLITKIGLLSALLLPTLYLRMQVLGISMSTHLTDVHLGVRSLAERRVIGISPCSLLHFFHSWRVLAGLIEHWLVVHVIGNFIHSDRPLHRLGHFSVIRRERLTALSRQFSDHTALANAIVVHLLVVFGLLLTVAFQQQVRKGGRVGDCVVEGR